MPRASPLRAYRFTSSLQLSPHRLSAWLLVCAWLLTMVLRSVTAQEAGKPSASVRPTQIEPIFVAGVPREQCFPVERLPADLRPQAETLLLKLLDSEALYTLVGGMKPMSSGFERYSAPADRPDIARLEKLRQLLSIVRCGEEFYADIQVFATAYDGKRSGETVVFHLPTLARKIAEYPDFFGAYGVTTRSHPMEVLTVVEHDATFDRNRGYGYLSGYPKYAIDFFVAAQEEQKRTKKFVQRDFIRIATFKPNAHLYVWAVPKGYQENESDRAV